MADENDEDLENGLHKQSANQFSYKPSLRSNKLLAKELSRQREEYVQKQFQNVKLSKSGNRASLIHQASHRKIMSH